MATQSRREFGILLGVAASGVFFPARLVGAAVSGCAGSFPMIAARGRCSFCLRTVSGVCAAGPIAICAQCIALCAELIQDDDRSLERKPRLPPIDPASLEGKSREEIAAIVLASGIVKADSEDFEDLVDRLEMSARWRCFKPGLSKEDSQRIFDANNQMTRDELAEIVLSRGWPGVRGEPALERFVDMLEAMRKPYRPPPESPKAPPPPPGSPAGAIYCSFCGRDQAAVRKVIAGPTTYICDRCVEQAESMKLA